MRKTLMVGAMVSLLLCVAGCGKKLTCTGKMSGLDGTEMKLITKFDKDNKAKSATMSLEVDVKEALELDEDPTDEQMKEVEEELKEIMKDECEDMDVDTKGRKITIKCTREYGDDEEEAYDDIKKEMENSGLTCK